MEKNQIRGVWFRINQNGNPAVAESGLPQRFLINKPDDDRNKPKMYQNENFKTNHFQNIPNSWSLV